MAEAYWNIVLCALGCSLGDDEAYDGASGLHVQLCHLHIFTLDKDSPHMAQQGEEACRTIQREGEEISHLTAVVVISRPGGCVEEEAGQCLGMMACTCWDPHTVTQCTPFWWQSHSTTALTPALFQGNLGGSFGTARLPRHRRNHLHTCQHQMTHV
jgi:hypothetical protein